MGIAGVFENKDFGDGNIEIDAGPQEILKELQKEDSFRYQPLFPYLRGKGEDGKPLPEDLRIITIRKKEKSKKM